LPSASRSSAFIAHTHHPSFRAGLAFFDKVMSSFVMDSAESTTSSRPSSIIDDEMKKGLQPKVRLVRQNTGHTQYVEMLLQLDTVPRIHNLIAAFSTWILLAGFVIFPGTFTSLRKNPAIADTDASENNAERVLLSAVNNVPLLWFAVACCGIGTLSMALLWLRWRRNYIWLVNKIFL
jgi:hypothetical protein